MLLPGQDIVRHSPETVAMATESSDGVTQTVMLHKCMAVHHIFCKETAQLLIALIKMFTVIKSEMVSLILWLADILKGLVIS